MARRTLEEALEGVSFPCDRARLIDYARNNHIDESVLDQLRDIPARQYRDLSEVFTALSPSAPVAEAETEAPQAWWLQAWRRGSLPMEVAVLYLRAAADTWPHWVRLGQRLWFPWMK